MADIKTARVTWQEPDQTFKGTVGSGYTFDLASPAGPQGGSPMEFLLAGVAGCTAMDVQSILRKMREPLRELEVEISAQRAEKPPRVYTTARLSYVVRGDGIRPKSVERAIALSMDIYCSASGMFKAAGVQIETDYRLEP
jgi:putative redox protein